MGSSLDTETHNHVSSHDRAADRLAQFELPAHLGGVVIVGPNAVAIDGLEAMLSSASAGVVEASASRLADWKAATGEVLEVTRATSRFLRAGETAVVHLDAHLDADLPLPQERHGFVAARLGQILMGLADPPGYIVFHGELVAQAVVLDSLGDRDMPAVGSILAGVSVWELTDRTMFPGTPVAVCRADQSAPVLAAAVEWFESRRA